MYISMSWCVKLVVASSAVIYLAGKGGSYPGLRAHPVREGSSPDRRDPILSHLVLKQRPPLCTDSHIFNLQPRLHPSSIPKTSVNKTSGNRANAALYLALASIATESFLITFVFFFFTHSLLSYRKSLHFITPFLSIVSALQHRRLPASTITRLDDDYSGSRCQDLLTRTSLEPVVLSLPKQPSRGSTDIVTATTSRNPPQLPPPSPAPSAGCHPWAPRAS